MRGGYGDDGDYKSAVEDCTKGIESLIMLLLMMFMGGGGPSVIQDYLATTY